MRWITGTAAEATRRTCARVNVRTSGRVRIVCSDGVGLGVRKSGEVHGPVCSLPWVGAVVLP
jgi:hypothetical protein